MWSQFRTATNILFPRPPHQLINLKIFSRFLHFKLNNTFSSQSDVDSFLPWLQSKSGYQISSLLSIKNSIYGNSLFASKYIHAGDCILKVPFTVHLTSNNLLPEVNSLLPDHVGHVARLAIVVLIEQIKGQESEWAPYISCLPKPGELHSAIFWSEEELEMVRPSVLYEETIELKAQLEKEYLALRPALDQFPNLFKDIKYEDFMHAFALVASRAWGSCKEVSLIPFADFLNHDGASREILLSDKDKQISEVIADRDYAPGKQILVRYGNFANFELLLGFGFALSCNKYEQVQIRMNVSQHDPLHTMKLELLHKHTVPIVTNTSTLDSCTKSFIIKLVLLNDFYVYKSNPYVKLC
ncbi:hypothetical protein IFM89_020091 [Coptis chinensis]|uniref:SET domain-containing protein n=1 Tax=Coptis chinensis TaxID=261450 RepID=A0A835HFW2_9MAGN|nr:hypothetical protein IFM89_020091 [Coptis chinensis]